ncbi:GDSL-type esterase/lipase family protein [Rosistilla oblonga]|uniref:GDSL-type esterase/lipase family protein n=1 Tax=Rosistilla oblonga TaxID=2527990 RepID=UPI003A982A88
MLLITNLATLAILVSVGRHLRVLPKAYQRLVVEKRVPGLTSAHEINRRFQPDRQLHEIYDSSNVHYLVIGDSLTSQVSWQELMGRSDIAGRGINGDTSAGVLERIDDYNPLEWQRIFLLIGTNDVLQGERTKQTLGNIKAIVEKLQRSPQQRKTSLLTVPPLARWMQHAEKRNESISVLNEQIKQLETENTSVLDLAVLLRDDDGYLSAAYTVDGIHMNAQGYLVLKSLLESSLPTTQTKNDHGVEN